MDPGHPAVGQQRGRSPRAAQDGHALVGHRQVGRPGRDHQHPRRPGRGRAPHHRGQRATHLVATGGLPVTVRGRRMVGRRRHLVRRRPGSGAPGPLPGSDSSSPTMARTARASCPAVDGLGQPLAQPAVVVDPGEPEIGEGQPPQPGTASSGVTAPDGRRRAGAAGRVRPWSSLSCLAMAHDAPPSRRRPAPDSASPSSGPRAPSPRRPCFTQPDYAGADVHPVRLARRGPRRRPRRAGRPGLRPPRELHRGHRQRHRRQPRLRRRPAHPARGRPRHPPASHGAAGHADWPTIKRVASFPLATAQCRTLPGRAAARGRSRAHQLDGRGRPHRRRGRPGPSARPPPPSPRGWRPSSTAWTSWPRTSRTTPTTRPASWPWPAAASPRRPATTRPASSASSARTIPAACTPSWASSRPAAST